MNTRLTKEVSVLTLLVSWSLICTIVQGEVIVSAVISRNTIMVGQSELVFVDVYVNHDGVMADGLIGYQVNLDVTGGDSGTLWVESQFMDPYHSDFVFAGRSFFDCTAAWFPDPPICAVLLSSPGVVVENPGYLGSFLLYASSDAQGLFEIRISSYGGGLGTILLDNNGYGYGFSNPNNPALIWAGSPCLTDSDCITPGVNTCWTGGAAPEDFLCVQCVTDDDCTQWVDCQTWECDQDFICQAGPNEPVGTSCEDGLFCTSGDTCDGAGSCIGGLQNSCRAQHLCCECTSSCQTGTFCYCP